MAIVTLLAIVTRAISFIFRIYVSRKIGAESLGIYQIAMSVLNLLLCLCASGLPVTASRKIAENNSLGLAAKNDGIATGALIICGGAACLMTGFIYLAPSALHLVITDMRSVNLIMILLPALLSSALYMVIRSWFWGQKRYLIYAVTELGEEIIKVALSLLLLSGAVVTLSGSVALCTAFVIGDIIIAVILFITYLVTGGRITAPKKTKELLFSSAPLTATRVLTGAVSSLVALLLPALLVRGGLSVSESTAMFGRASGMAMPLVFVPGTIIGSLAVVLLPEVAGLSAKSDRAGINNVIRKATAFALIISGLFGCVYLGFGVEICNILYKDAAAGQFLRAAALVMSPMAINQIVISILNSLGCEKSTFKSYLAGSAALIAAIGVLTPVIGVYSYAAALFLFHTVSLALNVKSLSRNTGEKIKVLLDLILTIACGAGAAMIVRFIGVKFNFFGSFFSVILCCAASMILFYMLIAVTDKNLSVKKLKQILKKSKN